MIKQLGLFIILFFNAIFAYAAYCPALNSLNCNAQGCKTSSKDFSIVNYLQSSRSGCYNLRFREVTGPCAGNSCRNQVTGVYCSYWVGNDGVISLLWNKRNYRQNNVDVKHWRSSYDWLTCTDSVSECHWQANPTHKTKNEEVQ